MSLYYIQYTGPGVTGDDALWWRPNGAGYTTAIAEAGRYTAEEARSIESMRGQDRALPVEVVNMLAVRRVPRGAVAVS